MEPLASSSSESQVTPPSVDSMDLESPRAPPPPARSVYVTLAPLVLLHDTSSSFPRVPHALLTRRHFTSTSYFNFFTYDCFKRNYFRSSHHNLSYIPFTYTTSRCPATPPFARTSEKKPCTLIIKSHHNNTRYYSYFFYHSSVASSTSPAAKRVKLDLLCFLALFSLIATLKPPRL